jgi:ribosomal protein L11 methylase PrmA
MSRATYAVVRYRVPAQQVPAATAALLRERFLGWAVSTPAGRHSELDLYAAREEPQAAMAALRELGLRPLRRQRISERRLLADVLPHEPCRLIPGVWVDPTDELEERPGRLVLRLPPIAAFGDGRHPSTRIGARLLRRLDCTGRRVLDLGCGTGVLGVLAGRWGADAVDFTDIDADAVRAARACCRLNGIVPGTIRRSDLLARISGRYDLVIGNLYADLLVRVAADPRLSRVLPHGDLILSGIHQGRLGEVQAAFTARGFQARARARDAWWHGMHLHR